MKKIFLIYILFAVFSTVFTSNSSAEGLTSASNTIELVQEHSTGGHHVLPNPIMVLPFVILLLMIATGPLFYHHFWEHHYPKVAILLGAVTSSYYLFYLHDSISLLHTMAEYLSFIALLASLFVASGGIYIKIARKSTPMLNTLILLLGAVIANIIGTTGASMLLIRPFMKINQNRIKPYHIIFFIFSVSNIGGALTPIGDPPLFLGFLRGVDFFWFITNIWYIWLPTILLLLTIFYIVDMRNKEESEANKDYSGKITIKGTKNFIYLAIILISVFIDPAVISWVPSLSPLPFGIREIIMFSVVYLSFKTADQECLKANEFDFEPIREVAFLFVGIFATMIPALQLIGATAKEMGAQLNAGVFYWATGSLSAFLDNAPTYLNFLSAELGKFGMDVNSIPDVRAFSQGTVDPVTPLFLRSISVAAVFFGAMTYIGNGPNFMVKAIAERAGVKMPSFFAYLIKYAIPILLPIFVLVWLIFFS
ncbi:MAG: sodium:proton antiporter [Bacteroidetes bacterium]|nr:sodium:proton antiporter [Bacteroidota bacterium]